MCLVTSFVAVLLPCPALGISCATGLVGRQARTKITHGPTAPGYGEGPPALAANNYAASLNELQRYAEARSLLLKAMPVGRRVLGAEHWLMLKMRRSYAVALYEDPATTLDDLRGAVTTLEDTARIARRVLGGTHPSTAGIERELRDARAALRARTE